MCFCPEEFEDFKSMYEGKSGLEAVKILISRRDAYEALAEESSELAKASLKAIRATKLNKNPTPVSFEEAQDNLREEVQDVLSCLYVLGIKIPDVDELIMSPKSIRWEKRLKKQFKLL